MILTSRSKKQRVPKRTIGPLFPEHGHTCLNCGRELGGNYCMNCGQPASTHRLSILHFIMHDLVHSLWHVDRGIFFTLKEVTVRPGYAALEYIRGRRTGKFPILTLLLLLLGAVTWITSFYAHHKLGITVKATGDAKVLNQIEDFVDHNLKWILLSVLPIISVSTWLIFRRTKLNYTEHLLVNSYAFGGYLVMMLLFRLLGLAIQPLMPFADENGDDLAVLFYIFGYWQAYHWAYSALGTIWRFAVLIIMDSLLIILALFVAAAVAIALNHSLIQHG